MSRRQLDAWVAHDVVRHPIRGVFHARQLTDSLDLRLAVLRMVVPEHCVVTDRTAGWLWGADMALAPGDHLVVPRAHVFCPPGLRLRNGLAWSGERRLRPTDVVTLGGLRVTTPLRTACDMGRLLPRDRAFAAMDAMAGLGAFSAAELGQEVERFKGYRGVCQLRGLAPFVDPGAQSPPESILRLRWLDVGLPRPVCQVPARSPYGTTWWIDLGLPERRFGAEYDGAEFHGDDRREHDERRRVWLAQGEGWDVVVVRRENLFGHRQDVDQVLRRAARRHGLLA